MQITEFENITLKTEHYHAVISLKNKPVNALSESFIENFLKVLNHIDNLPEIGVVILRSELGVFSAGGDATWMANEIQKNGVDGLLNEFERIMNRFRILCHRIHTARYLTIAEIKGHALAGGLELAAACDLRVAADNQEIRIGVPEMTHFGVAPSGGGGVYYLVRLLGVANAMQLVINGNSVHPRRALEMGLVQELLAVDEFEVNNEKRYSEIAKRGGALAIQEIKKMLYEAEPFSDIDQHLEADRNSHWHVMRHGNFKANVSKFAEKFGSRN